MFDHTISYDINFKVKQEILKNYFIDFAQNESASTLFITFEGSQPKTMMQNRYAWGAQLHENNIDIIGIKSRKIDWYRSTELHDFLQSNELQKIALSYDNVFLYGYSMGGFGALTFARLFKNSNILCFAPLTTLNLKTIPWETRFDEYAHNLDWTGAFSDAAKELLPDQKATIIYDPFCPEEVKHIKRLKSTNLELLKVPLADHHIAARLKDMKILKETALRAIDGSLKSWFPAACRARKNLKPYLSMVYFRLATRAIHYKNISAAMDYIKKSLQLDITNDGAKELAKMLLQHNQKRA